MQGHHGDSVTSPMDLPESSDELGHHPTALPVASSSPPRLVMLPVGQDLPTYSHGRAEERFEADAALERDTAPHSQLHGLAFSAQQMPRTSPTSYRDALRPLQLRPPVHSHDGAAHDPLGDVLDWLGRSDLAKDDRFATHVQNEAADDLDSLMDPDTPFVGEARELFADAGAVEKGQQARAQEPRSRPPKPAKPRLEASPSCPQLQGLCPLMADAPAKRDVLREEEEEWQTRQQRTGTVGRLVIYTSGDAPQEDILLRGGYDRHIVVAGVRDNGPASKAGVKAGDRLVSIDGYKDFIGMSADAVRDQLKAPTMVVFLGFVGKLQAEVRLTCTDRVCGLSLRHDLQFMDAPVQLCEERVFNAGIASLFLTIDDETMQSLERPREEAVKDSPNTDDCHNLMFELQRGEAYSLVRNALRRVEPHSPRDFPFNADTGREIGGPTSHGAAIAGSPRVAEALVKPGGDFGQVDDELLQRKQLSGQPQKPHCDPEQAPEQLQRPQDLQMQHRLKQHLQSPIDDTPQVWSHRTGSSTGVYGNV